MKNRNLLPILLGCAFASANAHAATELLAIGSISGAFGDLATQTAAPLENGVAGNLLGGVGSGIAYAGGNTFLVVPDRGPNAVSYNPLIDDTASYINRFQTFDLSLAPSAPGSTVPFSLTPKLTATTLLYSSTPLVYGTGALGTDATHTLGSGAPALNTTDKFYFTGRSDNFDPTKLSTNPSNARFDPESIRVSNDGKSVFISDEYGPYVYQFDRATGQRLKSFKLPDNLAVPNLSAAGNAEIGGNTVGRVANKGMEGLAITPDGKTLVGIMQAPLEQDGGKTVRIVTIDVATGTTHEYAYTLTTGSGVSDIVAINDHQFLVDERDGKGLGDGSTAAVKQLFEIDISGAQDVTAISGSANLAAKAVSKTLFVDLVALLTANGIAANAIPAKIEGLAFGPDVTVNGQLQHTLIVTNDNDFLDPYVGGVNNPNNFYVLGIDASTLSTFQAQQLTAVPEPSTCALMLAGLGVGAFVARRKRRAG